MKSRRIELTKQKLKVQIYHRPLFKDQRRYPKVSIEKYFDDEEAIRLEPKISHFLQFRIKR